MEGLVKANYFVVGEALVKRLALLEGVKAVLSARDIQAVEDNSMPTPSVMVLFAGEAPASPDGTSTPGDTQIVAQRWLIELVLGNYSTMAQDELVEAGYFVSQIIGAVQGWQPEGAIEPFRRLAAPAPQYTGKVSLYPLVFETLILTQQD